MKKPTAVIGGYFIAKAPGASISPRFINGCIDGTMLSPIPEISQWTNPNRSPQATSPLSSPKAEKKATWINPNTMLIVAASVIWIVLAVIAADYYGNSKAVRDAAEAGSGLLSQLATIQGLKAWLLPFSFLGIATFLTGFGFAFANILKNVRLRGDTMAAALPELKARKTHG